MLQAGVLVPVHETTPWINSFMLVETRDKLENLKLCICLDPTNFNKAIIREPYHFRMPEDIAHLLADACVMTVCNCKKGYWHQKLDEASSYLTTFNMELGRYRYTVMPFGITVTGYVFQRKLDQYFGQIEQVIVIADDIMVVGNQPNHRDHDVALTNPLETARKSNMHLNFDKLAYKKTEVDFFGETYTTNGCKPGQSKVSGISEMPPPTSKKQIYSRYDKPACRLLVPQKDSIKLPKLHVNQITKQLPARCNSLQQLKVATQADDELAILKHTIMQGWPKTIKQVPPELPPYWTFREELTIEDGLILKGTRIVILSKQCQAILKQIHKGHLGLNKCKLRANETVYWPGLNAELEDLVLNCELCLKYSTAKCKLEPSLVLGQEVPLCPWTKLATDIFHFEGASYLLIVDYTSCYPVGCKLTSMTDQHIASQFKLIVQNMDGLKH